MNSVEKQLSELIEEPPSRLERSTVVGAGAGDLVSSVDSRFGSLWVAWSRVGITGLTPAFASPTLESFIDHHRRVSYEASSLPNSLESEIVSAAASTAMPMG